jgi:simple sugar transport system ATP-binding protein
MRIELQEIRKWFGDVQANDGVSVTVEPATIHGLLGENGAGKTTLMKILAGYLIPDSGSVVVDGRAVDFGSPAKAIATGIGMLHQDPMDFPPLSVLDNFLLGRHEGVLLDRSRARRKLLQLATRFGFTLDPDAPVHTLTVGERQQLEILRLLSLGVKLVILDEPTTGISAPQKMKLFETLQRLVEEEGKSVIFVSHKLAEIEELCSQVTILRRGHVAGHVMMPCPADRLVELMFGQCLTPSSRESIKLGQPVLALDNLSVSSYRLSVSGVSLEVEAGEVIGLAGLEGSGQRLLLRACAGLERPSAGRILLDGQDMTGQGFHRHRHAGVAYLPAGRLEEGLIPGLTLLEHCVLASRQERAFVIDWTDAQAHTHRIIDSFHIIGSTDSLVESLSGGNQQRTLLALLPHLLRLMLLEHPTRGLDVESAIWVWDQLLERRRQGTAILFTSADLDEIMEHSDRILVFSGGVMSEAIHASEISCEELGYLVGGKGEAS